MNHREFQKLAKELACNNSPAKMRTATSRAYYAAFLTGLEALDKMGFKIDDWGKHGSVRDHLNNSGDDKIENAITKLSDLHGDRIKADYRFYSEKINKEIENPNTARKNVELAEDIIEALDDCINDPTRNSKITKAILEYRENLSV